MTRPSGHFMSPARHACITSLKCPMSLKSLSFSTLQKAKDALRNDEQFAERIISLLEHNNWQLLMTSSDIPRKLNPEAIECVLRHKQVNDPRLLLSFFHWSQSQMDLPQTLSSFSTLAVNLCNTRLFGPANGILEQMIGTHLRNSHLDAIVNSIAYSFKDCKDSNPVVFDILIDTYKKIGMLDEAANSVLVMGNEGFTPSLRCLNSLLNDLMKREKKGLFWKVYNEVILEKISPDVYTYTTLINAFCKFGQIKEARRIFTEMGEKGCTPNAVTYNTLIAGLCRNGGVAEAFELKREMAEKNLVADGFTYATLVGGLCNQRRSMEGRKLLDEMCEIGIPPNYVTYTTLIDGFVKEGDVEHAFEWASSVTIRQALAADPLFSGTWRNRENFLWKRKGHSCMSCINSRPKLQKMTRVKSVSMSSRKAKVEHILLPEDWYEPPRTRIGLFMS
ncbi:hypothetical protein H6P81_020621 [Aristolochia fimbriata]|uniref:Pentatricopeptide repeat-containing protein n=1 Tax=Aristolochia fimbriata TaxID=158543 RepID=A0AAV7DY65_ARIFI|nr:hypothetical protein H6P81_020621 [Aristolochia fimbriata]